MTMEEMRLEEESKQKEREAREKRLDEEVLCVDLTLPLATQNAIGVTGFTMKLSELADHLENDYENDERGVYTIQVFKQTNRWIENLPEADI